MCGIAGCFSQGQPVAAALSRMISKIGHRGPDASGEFTWTSGDWNVGFAHTRLAILDLSERGRQPMRRLDRYVITFNGEIYNFPVLRQELEATGYTLSSGSDTEVILLGYAAWGLQLLPRLRGMFAFAILDEQEKRVLLARDPLGIKPLYIQQSAGQFRFASEVRALQAASPNPAAISAEAIGHYLSFGSAGSRQSILQGISALQPGEYLEFDLQSPQGSQRRGRFRECPQKPVIPLRHFASRAEAVKAVGDTLQQSAEAHLISDVPVGLFLSGGIDSCVLLGLMARSGKTLPRTFSIGFSEQRYSETTRARAAAEYFRAPFEEILLRPEDLLGMLPAALAAMDQPTMDGVNTYVISKAVRERGIKVALSGLGSDELFAGYPSFRRAQYWRQQSLVPVWLRRALSAPLQPFRSQGTPAFRKGLELWNAANPQTAYSVSRRLFDDGELAQLAPVLHPDSEAPLAAADIINAISLAEIQGYMSNTLLRDSDFMSMAHALELRVPFVDSEVAELVWSLPGEWKMDSSRPKPLLLDAAAGLVPEQTWRTPKMGFSLPFEPWMRGPLREELDRTFRNHEIWLRLGIVPEAAAGVWNRFLAQQGGERWARSWSLFVLARWTEINGVAA